MKKGHVPLRTCIGCRKKRPAGELLRLTAQDDTVVLSTGKDKRTGRGCYVCPTEKCIEIAFRTKVLSRALRSHVTTLPSKEELLGEVEQKG
jgi:uncharacterized protein